MCVYCHEHALGSIAMQLAMKKIHDPETYNRIAVNRLRGRADDAITEAEVDEMLRILE